MLDRVVWKRRSETQKSVSMRVNKILWKEFKRKCVLMNVRYESDLLDRILRNALFPRKTALKMVAVDLVEQLDFIRDLRDKEEKFEKEEKMEEECKHLNNNYVQI